MNKVTRFFKRGKIKFYNDLVQEFIKLDQTYDNACPYAYRYSVIWLNRAIKNCPDEKKKKEVRSLLDDLLGCERDVEFAYNDLYI